MMVNGGSLLKRKPQLLFGITLYPTACCFPHLFYVLDAVPTPVWTVSGCTRIL
ncbi:hypothetical protein SAMN00790413_04979 [Deinococcus hopiensis KR-140]|uniref:Uncharacterized protein n=1 Tax=Deinococcus hopiensis KR-140 TaxID=695939 RepID=A0A1W1USI3_9DEIO|nr:hypothetical protein SAMN00790413_04979 [Deinococcus hopiensis KR-140]